MSRLSDEQICELYNKECWFDPNKSIFKFARAIEREAYKAGQERMRERAAVLCENNIMKCHNIGRSSAALALLLREINTIEIEEPK